MIIFTGVAGSGKSVQGKKLADSLALPWVSTGEFLRMLISGEKRKQMLAGKLLGDDEIIRLVQKIFTLIDVHEEFILDGFPRTVAQADWLLAQDKHNQLKITAVVHLQADEKVVAKRLLSRGRPDDTEEAIKERFVEYQQSMLPILEEFKEAGVPICEVNADQPVQAIHEQILETITRLINDNPAKN